MARAARAGRRAADGRLEVGLHLHRRLERERAEKQEHKDLSAATLRRQMAETRELLGRHLDLYQIHSATIESGVLDDAEVLAELAALRARGSRSA